MTPSEPESRTRTWIARAFSAVEGVVYVGLGILLASAALVLLGSAAITFARSLLTGTLHADIIELLDRILLILLVVELLYTVQISFREHTLAPEPFLLVGLIAAIRRVLVITAEFGQMSAKSEPAAQYFVTELGGLTVLILVPAIPLFVVRRHASSAAKRV